MGKRERRTFDGAFKRMAVELHMNGKTSTVVGRELGIGSDVVRRRTREFKSGGEKFSGQREAESDSRTEGNHCT